MVGNESQSRYGWKAEVGVFFGGVSADSSEDELRRIMTPKARMASTGLPRGGAPSAARSLLSQVHPPTRSGTAWAD
jgi:hypothetical protein